MPYCSQCGNQNSDNARFCSQCGTPLAAGAQRPAGQAGPAGQPGSTPAPNDATATITFGGPVKADGGEDKTGLNDSDAAAVDALPSGSALLVVQRGPGAGSRYLLDQDLSTVGRHPESDIFLDDITVSRRHVEFRREGRSFRVHDVGSLNGTYVNGDRVDDVELAGGDEVRIGKFRLRFFSSDAKGN